MVNHHLVGVVGTLDPPPVSMDSVILTGTNRSKLRQYEISPFYLMISSKKEKTIIARAIFAIRVKY